MAESNTPGNLAAWIGNAIGEGQSATAALTEFREAGFSFRTQSWYQLWGDVAASLANAGHWAGADPDTLPSADAFAPWAAGNAGQYAYQVKVHVRSTGSGEVGTRNFTFISDDVLTPGEAADAAINEYDAWTGDNEGEYAETVLGAVMTNAYTMTGQRR